MSQNTLRDLNNKESLFDKRLYTSEVLRSRPVHWHSHWHDYIELLFVREGCLGVMLGNSEFIMRENELLVIMPGELHSTDYDGKDILKYDILSIELNLLYDTIFDSAEFSKLSPFFFNSQTPQFFFCSSDDLKRSGIQPVINDLYSEHKEKKQGYTLSIRADLQKIFVWLLRNHDFYSNSELETGNFLNKIGRMYPVLEILKEQYKTKLSTRELSQKMNMSVHHFCRLFKKMTGRSLHSYLQSLRINEAVKLLFSTDATIEQIASHVGYNNVSYFFRVFKKETGFSPVSYRTKNSFPS